LAGGVLWWGVLSSRLDFEAVENRLTELVAQKRRAGVAILDLTQSNPTRVGLSYPPGWEHAPANPGARVYAPEPRGLLVARRAVADYYAERGVAADPDHVVLCASTSEAYGMLFKLLCDPGDSVLAPRPSYPLLEPIAALEGVRLERYPLRFDGSWHIDPDEVRSRLDPLAKAIVFVNPNNPTGSYLKRHELEPLEELALRHGLALIADEVFSEYAVRTDPARVPVLAASSRVPAVSLGGLSKLAGLPQVKVAWILVGGPPAERDRILGGLDHVSDTYLSCSGPMQHALPSLLDLRRSVGAQIASRTGENRACLAELGADVLADEGGWCAVLRLADGTDDEAFALDLLAGQDVLIHPGYLYDFSETGFVVVSLLPPPSVFREGIARFLRAATGS